MVSRSPLTGDVLVQVSRRRRQLRAAPPYGLGGCLDVGNRDGLASGRELIESVARVDDGGLALGRGRVQVSAHVGKVARWPVGLERLSVRFQVGVGSSDGP